MKAVLLILTSCLLCSCSVYRSNFTCPDSKGADCKMLSRVDQMIDSGEIETAYMSKKCKGGKCKLASELANLGPKQKVETLGVMQVYEPK
jgi:hypothetical protein